MYRASTKKTGKQDKGTNIGLCPNGVINDETSCYAENVLLPRHYGQNKICSTDGCERIATKRNLCEKHYRQYWRSVNKKHNAEYARQYYQNIRKPILKSLHKPKEKTCLRCDKIFIRTGSNQKFCSKTCQNNLSHKKKRQNPEFKLIHNIRSRLRKALRGKSRDRGILDLTGCSILELKTHIESFFSKEMNWNNYGTVWEIDHIEPLFKFDLSNPEQLKIACNYKNLRPMLKEEHKVKSILEQKLL